ncbi:MAG: 4-hydroxy-tetrahydrodipicolinate synthase [Bacteroidetes bacterium]|jgi:4-hydroxy-tetrahydrodipicolinate synthase|nr:4-hydroxy-tetrahydrodipicolinate synthase [Bacteroidota bacterium]MDA1209679.1 4-hydroxy-tetrahydrodipicolinate synthase [Bacteroidota bacterium]
MTNLIGTGVALITPFDVQGAIDFEALKRIVNFQIDKGINYLVVLGTTAESVTLTKQEKEAVLAAVLAVNANRVPIVLGVGGNDTQAVVDQLKQVNPEHIAAVLSVSPMYNKPSQPGLIAHFTAVAQVSPVPVLLYNVPGRTASNMLPSTVLKLAAHKNIIGIKEASGDLGQAMEILRSAPEGFLVISGDDLIALPMTLMGGDGVISVIGQAYPEEFSQMIQAGLNGNSARAKELHYDLMPIIEMIFEQGNPSGIKALLNKKGLCENSLRLPLVPVDDSLAQRIEAFSDRR